MRRVVAFGVVWLAAAAACSGYGSATTAPGDDASADSAAADSGDDGAPPPDADAAPPPPFCATRSPRPTFCSDFDLSQAATDGWVFENHGAPDAAALFIGLDTSDWVTPPKSFRVAVGSSNPGYSPGIDARLGWNGGPVATSSAHVEFKARIDSVDAFKLAWLATIDVGRTYNDVVLQTSQQQTTLRIGSSADGGLGTTDTVALDKVFPLGVWTQVALDFDFSPSTKPSVTVDIGGAKQ
ncbi:MAG TPA: hypothetical protein VIF62_11690, partial [Labilithrix sp.]